jgi:anaerobic selenocysteine-containing dehydrogenase
LCRTAFADDGGPQAVPFDRLLAQGFAPLPEACAPPAPFANGGFPTPSGRCELFSQRLADLGMDPLPGFLDNHESVTSRPDLAQRYPLAMISPPARNFLNSTFVNVTTLRDAEGEPRLDIHPVDAQARGITDGAWVRVHNDRGSTRCKARVTDRTRTGVVVGLGIWWRKWGADGTNVNQLTSQALTDMGRAPTFYDCLVEVSLSRD